MIGLKNMLLEEQRRLENILSIANHQLENAPVGTLHVSNCNGYAQFYVYNKNSKTNEINEDKKNSATYAGNSRNPKYVKKSENGIVKQLAQTAYARKTKKLAEKRLSQIRRITKDYDDREIEKIYETLHPQRKKMVDPIVETWEQELEMWIKKDYSGKEFLEGMPVIFTERGERVRSKSEKIMADYFYHHNIPYKYECPLSLKGMGTVYPDFTFLSPVTRREIYWEHDGKMDDPVYARKAIKKIEAYEKSGIYVGERLIVTFETSESVLSTRVIETQVRRYLNNADY